MTDHDHCLKCAADPRATAEEREFLAHMASLAAAREPVTQAQYLRVLALTGGGLRRVTITLVNPWSRAVVERDITDLTQNQLDAYPLDEDVCAELAAAIAPCTPAQFLEAYVDRVGPEAAGVLIIGS